jgi:transcriptional antiterminator RfaH
MKNWYVIKTKAKREDLAAANLDGAGLEIFNPKIKQLENLFGNKVWVERPLFPSYIFSKFDVFVNYRRVKYAGGVREVVGFGAGPVPVDENIIKVISNRVDSKGFFEIDQLLNEGDMVEIVEGPLEGLVGILEQKRSGGERVAVLLNTINYQARVLIESNQLQRSPIQ